MKRIHTHAPIQSYLLPFFVAYSLQNEKAVMKGYKYVNKNSNWSRKYNTLQNPYNKQVFIESYLRFSTAINL